MFDRTEYGLIWHLVLTDSTPTILRGRKSSQKLVLVHRIPQLRTSAWLAVFYCSLAYFFFFLRRRLKCRGQGLTASLPPGAELAAAHKPAENCRKYVYKTVKQIVCEGAKRRVAESLNIALPAVRMCPACSCMHYFHAILPSVPYKSIKDGKRF